MSLECRVEKLEADLFQLRKMVHKKEDNQHQVWNDMQEEVLKLCQTNAERLTALESRASGIELRLVRVETDINEVKERVARLETDVSEVKQRIVRLEADVAEVKDRVESLETKVDTAVGLLQQVLAKVS